MDSNQSAAIILVALPIFLIFLFFQRYIFAGIVLGAVKEYKLYHMEVSHG